MPRFGKGAFVIPAQKKPFVIPAQAGIQFHAIHMRHRWIPACAGMTAGSDGLDAIALVWNQSSRVSVGTMSMTNVINSLAFASRF